MKRLFIAALLALASVPASAQYQRMFGWCEQGGQRSVTNGVQSSTKVQASYAACTVTIFDGSTTNLSLIFSDAAHTQLLANPFTATSTGFWAAYAATGVYDVQFSGAGIASPFSIAGYTLGGGGGGGGTVGPGTVNNLAKFTSQTNVGNATCTDDGITPMSCGLGVSLAANALFTVKPNNGTTGTTSNLLVARDGTNSQAVQNAQPTDSNNVIGVAGFGAGTSGNVSIAYSGQFPCTFDNQTSIGDWVTLGSSSRCHDAGATEPSGIENMGRINSVNAGAGTLAGVDWGLPDSTNTSSGGGTGVVVPCATASAVTYYPTASSTVGCDPAFTTDGAGNATAASITTSGTAAGYFASQQGASPSLGVANSNYLYADTAVTTTFGTALPSTPGTLNQFLTVTGVPDATHIKLGYSSNGSFTCLSSDQWVDASCFSGTHWTDKVVAAYTALGVNGGTIIVPDSIADDGHATVPSIPSNVTLFFTGTGTFIGNIVVAKFSKIFAPYGATLQLSGSGITGISYTGAGADLQSGNLPVYDGLHIDCNSQTNSTGMNLTAASGNALFNLNKITITNCTNAGLQGGGFQFSRIKDVHYTGNAVGLKYYSTGGGSSVFWDNNTCSSSSTGVCAIFKNTSGSQVMTGQTLLNFQCQNGSVACIAIINSGAANGAAQFIITGGSPELNNTCGGPVTIDTVVIPCSGYLYTNNATVTLDSTDFEDATANPETNIVNHSILTLVNPRNYGVGGGILVQADSTSYVTPVGEFGATGLVENVSSYPSSINNLAYVKMYGTPISQLNSAAPNDFAGNPILLPIATSNAASNSTAVDPLYGTNLTVTFNASTGNRNTNRIIFNTVTTLGANADNFISLLLKPSVDAAISVGDCSNNFPFTTVAGKAGQWVRAIMYENNVTSGTLIQPCAYASDSVGATVAFTRLVDVLGPTGTEATHERISQVLGGDVNPNQVSGVLQTVRLGGDFTTAVNTNFQTINDGGAQSLSWSLPSTTQVIKFSFTCELSYLQLTANDVVSFGIQAATANPTNIFANGVQFISGTGTDAKDATLATLATTTATTIVSGTPVGVGGTWNVHLAGTVENPASTANIINIMVKTATAADQVTVRRGSFCTPTTN